MREWVEALEGIMTIKKSSLPAKKRIDVWGKSGKGFPIMQNLKTRLDPDRLLNPGRFVGGI